MDKKVVGREAISHSHVTLEDNNSWKAVCTTYDRVLYEGETEWVEENIAAIGYHDVPELAIQVAMTAVLNYLTQNVYEKGFKGLIEYREFEKQLEEAKAAKKEVTS